MHTLAYGSWLFSWKPNAPSCDSPVPTSPGAPFPHSLPGFCPLPSQMPSWGRAGRAQVPWMGGVCEPTLSKVPRGAAESPKRGCGCQQLPPFHGVWPQGNDAGCPSHAGQHSGSSCNPCSASSAHLCSTSCLCPAGALLHCLSSRLLCV